MSIFEDDIESHPERMFKGSDVYLNVIAGVLRQAFHDYVSVCDKLTREKSGRKRNNLLSEKTEIENFINGTRFESVFYASSKKALLQRGINMEVS